MFDRPPHPLGCAGFGLGQAPIQQACHDIEPAVARSPCFGRMSGEPDVCTMAESALFSFVDGFGRIGMNHAVPTTRLTALHLTALHRAVFHRAVDHLSAFHFDEDQQAPALRDEVDLDTIGSDVPCDDAIPSGLEVAGGSILALESEPLACVRSTGAHTNARVEDGNASHRGDTDR